MKKDWKKSLRVVFITKIDKNMKKYRFKVATTSTKFRDNSYLSKLEEMYSIYLVIDVNRSFRIEKKNRFFFTILTIHNLASLC